MCIQGNIPISRVNKNSPAMIKTILNIVELARHDVCSHCFDFGKKGSQIGTSLLMSTIAMSGIGDSLQSSSESGTLFFCTEFKGSKDILG